MKGQIFALEHLVLFYGGLGYALVKFLPSHNVLSSLNTSIFLSQMLLMLILDYLGYKISCYV